MLLYKIECYEDGKYSFQCELQMWHIIIEKIYFLEVTKSDRFYVVLFQVLKKENSKKISPNVCFPSLIRFFWLSFLGIFLRMVNK